MSKRLNLLILGLLFSGFTNAENDNMEDFFGLSDAVEQGWNNASYYGEAVYTGIDPPYDPDGVPVDGGLITIVGGALYIGMRQLRKNSNESEN